MKLVDNFDPAEDWAIFIYVGTEDCLMMVQDSKT
jgi:hypothetical protein